jgi:conjugative relaxase-like TrwC/TraI family protein
MMNLHKLSAGNGYTYLTRQVAANDAADTGYANLGEYYSERGESPGVWLGRGLAGLDGGPQPGDVVHEAQVVALFGQGRHPNADVLELRAAAVGTEVDTSLGKPFAVRAASSEFRRELARRIVAHNRELDRRSNAPVSDEDRARLRSELGRDWFLRDHGREPFDTRELTDYVIGASRPGKGSIAGYDLTFSPVKSVSALWALADPATAREIAAAHEAAVRDVVDWLEREAVYTRLGAGAPQQVDTRGLLGVAFTHRDSRAGDPDLHTHVAISNKVQTRDGRWLALDGRPLHRAAVAASERYNTRLEALLTTRLGVRFTERPDDGGKRPVREVIGVDPRLAKFWSKRRQVITARQQQLAAEFAAAHGRTPDFAEQTRLFAQATTDTRQRKHAPRSEGEQRVAWWGDAASVLGGDLAIVAMLREVLSQPAVPVPDTIDEAWVARTAADVVRSVAERASTWRSTTIRSEIERRSRYGDVPLAHLDAVVEATLARALSPELSVRLGGDDGIAEPAALRRADGSSVFEVAGSQLYTSREVLEAEARILAAASLTGGAAIAGQVVELALLEAQANGTPVNDGQAALVRSLATSGLRVQLSLAPAGAGKTTALGVLAHAWAEGGGTVVGLAPTGRAADELRRSLGTQTDTIAKLLVSLDADNPPPWVDAINDRTLLIVDEAGAASTASLDRVIALALDRGASVRLIGDTRQLSNVAAGGVLRDIAESLEAASLETLVRFADPTEARASLGLRVGDATALGFYLDRGRVHAGDHASTVELAYAAWYADRAAGHDSLLLAHTNQLVRELNLRAQADLTDMNGPRVQLHDDTTVGVGESIVTRRNDRRVPITSTDWVKNGDRWRVDTITEDGGLRVTHADTRRSVTLPPTYVRRFVELGYAATVHLAQGSTADTCHVVLTGDETRETLYVAMSRGRQANHLYLDVGTPADPHAATTPEALNPATSVEILEHILATEGAKRSATTQRRLDADPIARLRDAAIRYCSAVESIGTPPAAQAGPLPWLPELPAVDDASMATYLSRRFELVRELAGELPVIEALPDTRWAAALQTKNAALARQLAAWRVTNGVDPSEFRPCGSPAAGDGYRRRLEAQVRAAVGTRVSENERWRQLLDPLVPGIAGDTGWPMLAAALTRASSAGYDVAKRLPDLVNRRPLPPVHAARSLYWRFLDDCPDAVEPERTTYRYTPPPAPPRPEPLPDYLRSQSRPSISRGGPSR